MCDSRHGRRRRPYECGCLRARLVGHRGEGAGRYGGRSSMALARRARLPVPPLGARCRPGRGAGGVPPSPTRSSGDQTSRRRARTPVARRRSRSTAGRLAASSRTPTTTLGAGPMLDACGLKGSHRRRRTHLSETREFHRERRTTQPPRMQWGSWQKPVGEPSSSTASCSSERWSCSATSSCRPPASCHDRQPPARRAGRAQGAGVAPGGRDRRRTRTW